MSRIRNPRDIQRLSNPTLIALFSGLTRTMARDRLVGCKATPIQLSVYSAASKEMKQRHLTITHLETDHVQEESA